MRSSAPASVASRSDASVRKEATSPSVGPYFRCSCFRSAIRARTASSRSGSGTSASAYARTSRASSAISAASPRARSATSLAEGSSSATPSSTEASDADASATPSSPVRACSAADDRSIKPSTCANRPSSAVSSSVSPSRGPTASISRTWYARRSSSRSRPRAASCSSSSSVATLRNRSYASRYAPSATSWVSPAYRSRKPVWTAGASRRCVCPCPWCSTSPPPSSASAEAVASCPPMRAVDRPSLPIDRARIELAVFGPVPRSVDRVEASLDAGRGSTVADERGGAPLAQGEQQPHGHHRLPGAGLAGEHVQARRELQVEVGDHPEAADVELAQHGRDASALPRHLGPLHPAGRPGDRTCPGRA